VREKSVTSISRHSRQERVCTFERLFVRAEKKRHIVGHDSEGLVKGIPANVIVWQARAFRQTSKEPQFVRYVVNLDEDFSTSSREIVSRHTGIITH